MLAQQLRLHERKKPWWQTGSSFLSVIVNGATGRERDRALLADYSESGLYKNDGSKELLWTADWSDYLQHLTFAADGIHVVGVQGSWWWGCWHELDDNSLKQETVWFYANGKVIRAYSLGDLLVRVEQVRASPDGSWLKDSMVDEEKLQLEMVTHDGLLRDPSLTIGEIHDFPILTRQSATASFLPLDARSPYPINRNVVPPFSQLSHGL